MEAESLFVPYELSLKLIDKGCNEELLPVWYSHKTKELLFSFNTKEPDQYIVAIFYKQAIDWLFEKQNIWITIENYQHSEPTDKLPSGFTYYIEENGMCVVGKNENYFNRYQEVLNQFKKHLN